MQSLSNVKDQKCFWITIKKLNKTDECYGLPVAMWEEFYSHVYSTKQLKPITFYDTWNPNLDRDFSMFELTHALDKCKNNKSPGNDGIPFEIYKNLPQNWLLYLLRLINKILYNRCVPNSWTEILLTMIHKKGPMDDPENYRGIALVNTSLKIFTQMILSRLETFVNDNNILPECQNGFRKGRGCIDNVFTLSSIINIHLRLKSRKLFAAFVDLKRAFDSLNHSLLWEKLYNLGISGNMISILKNLYDFATVRVKTFDGITNSFDVSEGVLQGETLSPLLFSLFIADIESFFRERGCNGANIDGYNDCLLLLYADDLVILSDSEIDITRKLNVLKTYCDTNYLTVNTNKTKIIRFCKGGSHVSQYKFNFCGEIIETVPKYTYLGVIFTRSGLFRVMVQS